MLLPDYETLKFEHNERLDRSARSTPISKVVRRPLLTRRTERVERVQRQPTLHRGRLRLPVALRWRRRFA